MGTWGTPIFSDDLASDIKLEFRNKIGFGKTSIEATDELIKDYSEEIKDYNDSSVFWLSLASTQWDLGRLLDHVKNNALEIIENGQDLERWNNDIDGLKKRKSVLCKLKAQLESEPPKPKEVPKPFIRETKMEKGDLISYQLENKKFVILKVIDIEQDQCGDRYPLIEILDFYENRIPELSDINKIGYKNINSSGQFYLSSYGKRDIEPFERLKVLNKETKVDIRKGAFPIFWWRDIDNLMIEAFQ